MSIKLPLRLGDLLTEDAYVLCDFLDHFGENTIMNVDKIFNYEIFLKHTW